MDARWHRRRRTALRALLAVVAVVVLAGVTGAVLLDRSLERQDVGGLAGDATSDATAEPTSDDGVPAPGLALPDRPPGVRHVLVAGLDDRSVLSSEEQAELSTGDAPGSRAEIVLLLRVDPGSDRLDALRFPRDLSVTRCDGTEGRINAAYVIGETEGRGGSTCLVQTVTRWSGLPIDHVVEVDFRGFVDLVDAVDGVEVGFDRPLVDERAGLDVPAGCVTLDGAEALALARARHLDPNDSDLDRIDRQQELIAAALDQVASRRTLTDPGRLRSLVFAAQRNLTFDDRMTSGRLLEFARLAAERGGDDLASEVIPGTVDRSTGAWLLAPDEAAADALFARFAAGQPLDLDGQEPAGDRGTQATGAARSIGPADLPGQDRRGDDRGPSDDGADDGSDGEAAPSEEISASC